MNEDRCPACSGAGQVQDGVAWTECPACALCKTCHGDGTIDCGGVTPWGSEVLFPCPECNREKECRCIEIGASWLMDSSLERWFPLTANELANLKALNADKFRTIQAYCEAASSDKWKIKTLTEALQQLVFHCGKPKRSEWMNEESFLAAAKSYQNALDVIAKAKGDQ